MGDRFADEGDVGQACDRAPVPSRAGELIPVGVGTLWQPSPSAEDRSAYVSQSATAAGFALDSALG